MEAGLGIAGLICVAMAIGHTAIGVVWVLPHVTEERVPPTPFGSRSTTVAMVRVTWFVVTCFALGTGGLLITMAAAEDPDPRTVLLRWLAATWAAATVMAFLVSPQSLRRPRAFMRLPVPALWVVVAVLCWTASA